MIPPFDQIGDFFGDLTGRSGARAARHAADTQARYGGYANQAVSDSYKQGRSDISSFANPGMADYSRLRDRQNMGMYRTDPGKFSYGEYDSPDSFAFEDFDIKDDAGYNFRMEQGLNATRNKASAMGQTGGNLLMELMRQGQGMASEEADRAYGRFADQRNFARGGYDTDRAFGRNVYSQDRDFGYGVFADDFSRRQSENAADFGRQSHLGAYGPQGMLSLANLGQGYGQNMSNNFLGIGNAQAGGIMGAANARAQGSQNLMNLGLGGLGLFL